MGIEEHFLRPGIRDAWHGVGLEATDPSVAFHPDTVEGRLTDLAQERLVLMDETGLDVQPYGKSPVLTDAKSGAGQRLAIDQPFVC